MSLFAIRKGERRHAWAAFSTLFALVASHSVLETARDALFLAKVPASRLPWVYLAIAALSFSLVKVQAWATNGLRPERALSVVTLAASAVTFGFSFSLSSFGAFGLYALYVWSGVLVSLVLVHFWALASDLFTITQAKRLYGFIGTGSVLGAIVGSGSASLLSRMIAPERLVLIAATGFAVTGAMPWLFATQVQAGRSIDARTPLRGMWTVVGRNTYGSRVIVSLFVATVCLTTADYVFKSTVAALVPRDELGAFLGAVYFAANLLSLVCQVWLVARLLEKVSLGAALAVLPALFVAGGLAVAVTGGLAAVLTLKGTDGALRYSLHRTVSELLLIPFGEDTRRRLKTIADVVSQRGGQVVASGGILAFTALGAPPRTIAIALTILAVIWVATALGLRRPYVELFRSRLKAGRTNQIDEYPELDVASLEGVLAALESHHDGEVLAALDVLEREGKAHVIPALILYHPSERVVLRALEILTTSGRTNVVRTLDRVLDHPSPVVRAATIAARSVLEPDTDLLRHRLDIEESPVARATIIVNLVASGEFSAAERAERVGEIVSGEHVLPKVALADAIGRRRAGGFDDVLRALASAEAPEVRRAAVTAMGRVDSVGLLSAVVDALEDETTRHVAEKVLVARGTEAFDLLFHRFRQVDSEPELRYRIPVALSLIGPDRAIPSLVEWLPSEVDGKVRFQIIRSLERLVRRHPTSSFDRAALDSTIAATLARAYLYLDARRILARGVREDPARKTPGHDLLFVLLRDKEANARGRLFRLLGLLYPTDDFGQIYRGLGANRELRATSTELVEGILREPLRGAVLGLIDDGDDTQRLARAGRYHRSLTLDYPSVLRLLLEGDSDSVRDVTRYHTAELGLSDEAGQGRAA